MRLGGELPLGALPKSGTGPLSKLFAMSIHCRLGSTGLELNAAEGFFSVAHLHQGKTLRPFHAQQIVREVHPLQAGKHRASVDHLLGILLCGPSASRQHTETVSGSLKCQRGPFTAGWTVQGPP